MTLADPLTLNELRKRVKKAKNPVEKTRFLAVYHAKRGLTAKEIARTTLHTARWVQQMVRRYNQEGPEALQHKRHHNPGQRPKLTPEEQQRVLEALQGPPPDRGLWTWPKLRNWVERELGKKLSLSPIYRLLHEMGFALRLPRPQHRKRDEQAQVEFKLSQEVEAARREGRRVKLLAHDKHRLGLKPVYRQVWNRKGERPKAVVAHRYRWFYVCTVAEPTTGWNLSLEEMMGVVAERRRVLQADAETLRRHTLFHWWPTTKEST